MISVLFMQTGVFVSLYKPNNNKLNTCDPKESQKQTKILMWIMYLSKRKVEETESVSAVKMIVFVIQIHFVTFKTTLGRPGPLWLQKRQLNLLSSQNAPYFIFSMTFVFPLQLLQVGTSHQWTRGGTSMSQFKFPLQKLSVDFSPSNCCRSWGFLNFGRQRKDVSIFVSFHPLLCFFLPRYIFAESLAGWVLRAPCDLFVVLWRGQNVCCVRTPHFERTIHTLFPPAFRRSWACRVIWADWSEDAPSSPFTVTRRRPAGHRSNRDTECSHMEWFVWMTEKPGQTPEHLTCRHLPQLMFQPL